MKKGLLSILILCATITTKTIAQTSADYNYSITVRGFSMMQLPKILNQTNTQDYTRMAGNGAILKLDRKSTRLNSSHTATSRMPSSA